MCRTPIPLWPGRAFSNCELVNSESNYKELSLSVILSGILSIILSVLLSVILSVMNECCPEYDFEWNKRSTEPTEHG